MDFLSFTALIRPYTAVRIIAIMIPHLASVNRGYLVRVSAVDYCLVAYVLYRSQVVLVGEEGKRLLSLVECT